MNSLNAISRDWDSAECQCRRLWARRGDEPQNHVPKDREAGRTAWDSEGIHQRPVDAGNGTRWTVLRTRCRGVAWTLRADRRSALL